MKRRSYILQAELQEKKCAFPGCNKTFKTRHNRRKYHDPAEGRLMWYYKTMQEYKQLKEKDRINSAIMDALLKDKGII